MSSQSPKTSSAPEDATPVRAHEFDGIQEIDKPMPNWWLATFYLAIVYAFFYWAVLHQYSDHPDPGVELTAQMERAAQEAARQAGVLTNEILWQMSRDPAAVKAGREHYVASCAACHLADLAGAIGPNLKDQVWIHGGQPMEIMKVITEGVGAKGMPTWGPILGRTKISEVTAFILSHHTPPAGGAR